MPPKPQHDATVSDSGAAVAAAELPAGAVAASATSAAGHPADGEAAAARAADGVAKLYLGADGTVKLRFGVAADAAGAGAAPKSAFTPQLLSFAWCQATQVVCAQSFAPTA